MIHAGIITNIKNSKISIKLICNTSCKDCRLCATGNTQNQEKKITIYTNNNEFKINDMVKVKIKEPHIIGISFVIFIVPALLTIVGYHIINKYQMNILNVSSLFVSAYLIFIFKLNKKIANHIEVYKENDNPS